MKWLKRLCNVTVAIIEKNPQSTVESTGSAMRALQLLLTPAGATPEPPRLARARRADNGALITEVAEHAGV